MNSKLPKPEELEFVDENGQEWEIIKEPTFFGIKEIVDPQHRTLCFQKKPKPVKPAITDEQVQEINDKHPYLYGKLQDWQAFVHSMCNLAVETALKKFEEKYGRALAALSEANGRIIREEMKK